MNSYARFSSQPNPDDQASSQNVTPVSGKQKGHNFKWFLKKHNLIQKTRGIYEKKGLIEGIDDIEKKLKNQHQ